MSGKFQSFIDAYGAARLARDMRVSKSAVSHWRNGTYRVSPSKCRDIESLSMGEITVHDLRPDIFGPAPSQAA